MKTKYLQTRKRKVSNQAAAAPTASQPSAVFSGTVVHGDGYGKVIGFPTANIDRREYARKKLNLRLGIWAGYVEVHSPGLKVKSCAAAIVVGPIDAAGLPKLEAHLIGFHGNLYGKKITFKLHKFLRPWKKFKTVKDLQRQIHVDIQAAKRIT